MPLFEYQCRKCDSTFELLVRRDESVNCPSCGADKPDKLLSAPAAHVAGRNSLPVACPPSDAPPCSPNCCRL